ncbi:MULTISPECIES: hypothetical protein [Acinetobacter]|uniref:hypothetical protein n=1 Tax=Acinetobacter TaxID=469 RepID=UPI0025801AB4|nr:hypothetical protein [Acinetobacter sp. UBA5984]
MAVVSKLNSATHLILSFIFASGFVAVALLIENKSLIYIFAGLLLFWQRYLVLKLHEHLESKKTDT